MHACTTCIRDFEALSLITSLPNDDQSHTDKTPPPVPWQQTNEHTGTKINPMKLCYNGGRHPVRVWHIHVQQPWLRCFARSELNRHLPYHPVFPNRNPTRTTCVKWTSHMCTYCPTSEYTTFLYRSNHDRMLQHLQAWQSLEIDAAVRSSPNISYYRDRDAIKPLDEIRVPQDV